MTGGPIAEAAIGRPEKRPARKAGKETTSATSHPTENLASRAEEEMMEDYLGDSPIKNDEKKLEV